MLSTLTIHIPLSYFVVCLALCLIIGAVAGIIGTAHFNQNHEPNEYEPNE